MKKALIAVVGLGFAAISLAQLSKHKDWGKSAEAYFLTPSEKDAWSRVATDADAEKFIGEYWAKRDPNPATSANEFRDEINRRIAAADEQFKMRNKRGSETSRGRLLVTLGLPTRVSTQRAAAESGIRDERDTLSVQSGAPDLEQAGVVVQTWTYAKDKFDPSLGIGELRVRINVDPQRGTDELMGSGAVDKAAAKIAEKTIVNAAGGVAAVAPSVPAAATGPGAAPAAPAAPPAAAAPAPAAAAASPRPAGSAVPAAPAASTAAATAAIPAAVRTTLDGIAKDKTDGSFWAGEFRAITGEPFYALQFYLPSEKASQPLKFGGVVWDEANQPVGTYWEDAALTDVKSGTRTDKVFDRSIALPAGSYRGSFGLFDAAGAPVASSGSSFKLVPASAEFGVSPLILANTLTPLTKRPEATDPFVFGMEKPIKVEPKGDHRFAKEDSLWYFYTVSNPVMPAAAAAAPVPAPATTPGATAATPPAAAEPKPRLMTRISVQRDGKDAFQPLTSPADLQILGPGYYASGSEIPLTSFEPGYYTFGIQVRDLNAPRESAAFKGIERKEDFIVLNADGTLPARAVTKKTETKTKTTTTKKP